MGIRDGNYVIASACNCLIMYSLNKRTSLKLHIMHVILLKISKFISLSHILKIGILNRWEYLRCPTCERFYVCKRL
jgi:hypothetical protein